MALNVATLVARVVADTAGFNAGMAGVEGRLQTMSASLQRTGGMLTRSLTLPILVAAGAAVKFGVDFQQQMEMIHTQAGASQREVDNMTKSVLALAPATRYGPVELSKALYHIESVGDHGAKALNVLKVAAQGAAVGNANLEDTASALAGTMRVFHVPAANAAQIMGQLNAVVGAGNMRMQDLNEAIATGLLPTAKGLGIGLNEIGAALATMTDESVKASVGATRLRTLLLLMTGETTKSKKVLESIGIAQGELGAKMRQPGGMIPALEDLQQHLNRFSKTDQVRLLAQAFGGARSAGTIIQLLNNLTMVHQKLQQINRTAGNFPEDVLRTTQTEAYKLHSAWAAIQTVLIRVGEILAPVVSQVAAGIAHLLGAFGHLSKPMQDLIVYGGLVVAALGPVLWLIGSLGSALALVASPVGAVVVGLVAIGGAAAYLYQHVQSVHEVFRGLTDALGLTAVPLNSVVPMGFGRVSNEMTRMHEISKVLDGAWSAMAPRLVSAWTVVQHAVGVVGQFVIQTFESMVSGIRNHSAEIVAFLRTAWNAIQAVTHAVWPIIKHEIEVTWAAIKIIIQTAMKVIGGIILAVMDVISGNWKGAWNAIKSATEALLSGIVRLIYTILKGAIQDTLMVSEAIGKAMWFGISKVFELLGKLASGLMSKIGAAIASVASWAVGEAVQIGKAIADGVISGVGNLASGLAHKLTSAVGGALGAVGHFIKKGSPSRLFADEVGKPIADGIIMGYMMGISDLPTKMSSSLRKALESAKRVIDSEQQKMQSMFQRMSDYILRAFDGATQAHLQKMQSDYDAKIKRMITLPMQAALKDLENQHEAALQAIQDTQNAPTATEAVLAQMQDKHAEEQRQQAIADARKQLSDAQATADPQQILQAQRSLNDALYEETVAGLQKTADAERKAADAKANLDTKTENDAYAAQQQAIQDTYDTIEAGMKAVYDRQVLNYQAERDLQRQHLSDQLTQLQEYLAKHPDEWNKVHGQIMKLMKAYGVDYHSSGLNLGLAFARGLRESIGAVRSAAEAIAKALAEVLQLHSPAKSGPLSNLDHWWDAFASTLTAGLDMAKIQNAIDLTAPNTSAALGTGAGAVGSAGSTVNVTVPMDGVTLLSGDRKAADELANLLVPRIARQISVSKA